MRTVQHAADATGNNQFGLTRLIEFVTICAILFALSGATGIAPCICLVMMALALATRRGPVVLLMFASASLAADWTTTASHVSALLQQFSVILIGASLCVWFRAGEGLRSEKGTISGRSRPSTERGSTLVNQRSTPWLAGTETRTSIL